MSAALRGKTIAITGTFDNLKRREVVSMAQKAGATVTGTHGNIVSKNVDLLVTGHSNVGVREAKAKHLGIQIVKPDSFLNFVSRGGASRMQQAYQRPAKMTFEDLPEKTEAMPWEMESVPRRRAAKPAFEETSEPMPWEVEAKIPRAKKTISAAPARAQAGPFWSLKGKTIGFAGSFQKVKKIEAAAMAEKSGAKVVVTGGRQMDILVCGTNAEANRILAKKKGILPVSEASFLSACRK